MPEWNAAATTPDLLDEIRKAVQSNTLEVNRLDTTPTPKADRVERIDARTDREVLDRYLADGMPIGLAIQMTRDYLAAGGDSEVYRVTKLRDQAASDTRTDRGRFVGLYRKAPRVYNGPSCGRTIPEASQVAGSSRKARARRLAEEWRQMRR